jgi:hypothetical protein
VGLGLTVAVVQPVLVAGLLAAAAHLNAYGSDSQRPLSVVLAVVGGLLWLLTIALRAPLGVIFLSGCALMLSVGLVTWSIASSVLHGRGVTVACTVLDVIPHTSTYTESDPNGGGTTTRTETDYEHVLECVGGHPGSATWSTPEAEVGQRLDVTYDPVDRVSPEPADEVQDDGSDNRRLGLASLGVSVLLRLGGVLWERWRHPWR